MKKISIILISLILLLVIFNKILFSFLITFTVSKLFERETFIEKIELNYSKQEIVLNFIEIRNIDTFYYKNIFEADKIKIYYNFKSLFSDLVIIDYVLFENIKFFLEFKTINGSNKILDDNIEVVKKLDSNYKPKIYPTKKKDKNFLILKTELKNSKTFIKTSNNTNVITINMSDMIFYKVGNRTTYQHYKNLFKTILQDLFYKVPNKNLRNLLKKTYKF